MAVAEFARRRDAQFEASKARGDRVRSRDDPQQLAQPSDVGHPPGTGELPGE